LPRCLTVPTAHLPEPMYATLGHELPRGDVWTFEPKYDGMRVIAEASGRQVRLVTRNGKDKSGQFPEIVLALRELARRAKRTLVLDGEVVARARRGGRSPRAASEFQQLQARMHLQDADEILRLAIDAPTSFMVFDFLRDGRTDLISRPLTERRERLDALFTAAGLDNPALKVSDRSSRGTTMLGRARRAGWEGIIAKRTDAKYQPGARSDGWLKLKLLFRAEFVVGGYTEPRKTRPYFGALLLGAYDKHGRFVYVGHTGGGFTREGLAQLFARLTKLERTASPFVTPPRTNERAHWVAPKIIVEVKFAEWTSERLLRQPIFLGVRDDKRARDVTIEGVSMQRWRSGEMKHDAA
jgi:bifunctional non-homologous end joining protein LigD